LPKLESDKFMTPKIAITLGDPAGIGSEIILKALNSQFDLAFEPVIIGSKPVIEKAWSQFDLPIPDVEIIDACEVDIQQLEWGKLSEEAGKLAAESVILAAKMAMTNEVDAMVTAPINKEAIQLAGYDFPGHTELLADLTNTQNFAMMLAGGNLKVILVTTHLAIKAVSQQLSTKKIYNKIKVADDALKKYWKTDNPIAVCALNPHAGEHGLFGSEETDIIEPAVEQARKEGINVTSPLAADTLFVSANAGKYAAVICMYHDQALIPLKLVAFGKGVNITLGLPIIRTSVDHGTAFDIAGKGIAEEGSLVEAINAAIHMATVNALKNEN
jgi:4-hydroxythreonine-4-phosphate dehydrogenase